MAQLFLDRFSMIFVSGHQHADVVATAPIFDYDKKLQIVAMTQGEPGEQEEEQYGFRIAKPVSTTEHITQLAQELQEDEISFFIRRGHDPLTFDLHARHLEWLLNKTYKHDAKPTPADLSRLEHYVYLYCAPKIKQRLEMELSGGRGKFVNLFIGTDRMSNAVEYEAYKKLGLVDPPYRFPDLIPKWRGEKWLADIADHYGGELGLDPPNSTSIERTTDAGYSMYICIAIHLRMLYHGLSDILPYMNSPLNPRSVNDTIRAEINAALTDIATSMAFLHHALSHSRAF
ncbi:hypothetical protein FRC01_011338 [Tulasnella sp. 417]|nr:hypothetical protein FRC01_011338 [Tulasnella sp. 417]